MNNGINEFKYEGVLSSAEGIKKSANRMQEILENTKKQVIDLNNYYKSDAATKLEEEFETFSKDFPKFVENVETMANNLISVAEDKKAADQARASQTTV